MAVQARLFGWDHDHKRNSSCREDLLAASAQAQMLATPSLASHYVRLALQMRHMVLHRAAWIGAAVVGVAAGACFLGDLFGPAGPHAVQFQFSGDSTISSGVPTPIRVTLMVDGLPASEPPVQLAIPDTTVIRFRTNHDTIIGCRSGQGNIVARITTSLSPSIDTTFRIRVSGGPASCP